MSVQYGFVYNQARCSGCKTCVVACKDWNDVKPGPAFWRRVTSVEQGKFPEARTYFLSLGCNHCAQPACMEVCPVDAISKRAEDGVVLVDRSKCIACGACKANCPYDAPQYGDDRSEPKKDPSWNADHPMQKCTLCYDRLAIGKQPACVAACMMRALDFGTLDELKQKYPESQIQVIGFPASDRTPDGEKLDQATQPSIRFIVK